MIITFYAIFPNTNWQLSKVNNVLKRNLTMKIYDCNILRLNYLLYFEKILSRNFNVQSIITSFYKPSDDQNAMRVHRVDNECFIVVELSATIKNGDADVCSAPTLT